MKIAAVEAIAGLARVEASEVVAAAYGGAAPVFGPDYIIPKPFDPRLILEIAPAVARAAHGQRRGAPADRRFRRLSPRPGALRVPLRPADAPGVRGGAQARRKRIVYAEGEDERVLRAAQTLVDDGIAAPDPDRPPRRDRSARSSEMGLRHATWTSAVQVLDPAADDDVFEPLVPRIPASGRTARHAAGRGGAAAAHAGRPWPPPCCCTPAWPMRRSAAAPATGGGRSSMSCRSSRAAPDVSRDLRAVLPDPAQRRAVHLRHPHGASIRPPSRSPK